MHEKMKRYIHILAMALFSLMLSSCVEKLGTDPDNDPAPKATIYQYAPGAGYNSDEDVAVRFVSNGKAAKIYYLVELAADKEAYIEANGEDAYIQKVISEGTEIPSESLSSHNVILTGMAGTYSISAVAAAGSQHVLSESVFYGLTWSTVSTGTYEFGILSQMGLSPVPTELQVCESDPTLYRFKDVFKPGYSLKIVLLPNLTKKDDYGTYTFARIPVQDTGFVLGENGPIGVRDIGYWQGDDSYVTAGGYESCFYTDGSDKGYVYVCAQYYVAAGSLGFDYDTYVPDAE